MWQAITWGRHLVFEYGSWLLVFGAALLVTATPGPGSFYVPARTLAGGVDEGLASSFGIAVGGLFHVAAGAIGLSAVIMASAEAFMVVKLLGAVYLVWLGIKTVREARVEAQAVAVTVTGGKLQAFRDGVVMEALNPKTAAFFLAFIPGFVNPAQNVALQFVIFGLITVFASALIDVFVTFTAATARTALVRRPVLMRRIREGAGLAICLLGVLLLFAHRPA
jgi:threonine/homoserine/homoserine lactone efflux protein